MVYISYWQYLVYSPNNYSFLLSVWRVLGTAGFFKVRCGRRVDWAHQHRVTIWSPHILGPGRQAVEIKLMLCLCPARATWLRCGSADLRAATATIGTMWRQGHIQNITSCWRPEKLFDTRQWRKIGLERFSWV